MGSKLMWTRKEGFNNQVTYENFQSYLQQIQIFPAGKGIQITAGLTRDEKLSEYLQKQGWRELYSGFVTSYAQDDIQKLNEFIDIMTIFDPQIDDTFNAELKTEIKLIAEKTRETTIKYKYSVDENKVSQVYCSPEKTPVNTHEEKPAVIKDNETTLKTYSHLSDVEFYKEIITKFLEAGKIHLCIQLASNLQEIGSYETIFMLANALYEVYKKDKFNNKSEVVLCYRSITEDNPNYEKAQQCLEEINNSSKKLLTSSNEENFSDSKKTSIKEVSIFKSNINDTNNCIIKNDVSANIATNAFAKK
jgi:hypothetical protein